MLNTTGYRMKYNLYISEEADKNFKKLRKKDKKQMDIINKKVKQIVKNPYHFKPLKGDLKGARRVHVGKSFVIIYEINEKEKVVRILDYAHHDKIY